MLSEDMENYFIHRGHGGHRGSSLCKKSRYAQRYERHRRIRDKKIINQRPKREGASFGPSQMDTRHSEVTPKIIAGAIVEEYGRVVR